MRSIVDRALVELSSAAAPMTGAGGRLRPVGMVRPHGPWSLQRFFPRCNWRGDLAIRRIGALCVIVIAGWLGVTMLPVGGTVFAATCQDQLVDETFTCEF